MELKTIERALMVLKSFNQEKTLLSTTELSEKLETNKSTISRVLKTLKKHNFLEQDNHTKEYRLGSAMAKIVRALKQEMDGDIVEVSKPFADKLRDTIGETVHIEIVYGNKFYLAYAAETRNPVSLTLTVEVGDLVAPNAHAGAKAIAAFSEEVEIERWLANELHSLTENTIIDIRELRKVFRQICQTGIAYDWEEYLQEINAIAAPIFNHTNNPVAAIIIVVPAYRMGKHWDQRFIAELKKTANRISQRLYSSRTV